MSRGPSWRKEYDGADICESGRISWDQARCFGSGEPRALTEPSLHAQWWAAADIRAEVGHHFTLDMGQWGQQPCEVLEVEPERLLRYRFTENWTLTWRLEPADGGTRLTLLHAGFDRSNPQDRFALDAMGKGWPPILQKLGEVLSAAPGA